jgi:nitroreductase
VPSPALETILNAARWAPSGDNAQPWSFQIGDEASVMLSVHVPPGNVYEYNDGEPTLISAGTLLENIAIAAPSVGKDASWRYLGRDDRGHRIALHFTDRPAAAPHPLLSQIERRSVDRRPYKMRGLAAQDRRALLDSVGPDIAIEWHDTSSQRWKIASLGQMATDIRLRIPETFSIHKRIVDWNRVESPDAIPSRALGLDAMTLKIMRWSLAKQSRTALVNRLGSPFFAGLQMDLVPGLFSAAYCGFRVRARASDAGEAATQLLRVGQAVQRFWLTATSLGLAMQPCVAILAFSHYGATQTPFTASAHERRTAALLARKTRSVFAEPENLIFLARIGYPHGHPKSRSTRIPLAQLIR